MAVIISLQSERSLVEIAKNHNSAGTEEKKELKSNPNYRHIAIVYADFQLILNNTISS